MSQTPFQDYNIQLSTYDRVASQSIPCFACHQSGEFIDNYATKDYDIQVSMLLYESYA